MKWTKGEDVFFAGLALVMMVGSWCGQSKADRFSRPDLLSCKTQTAPPGQPATDIVLINKRIYDFSTSCTGWS